MPRKLNRRTFLGHGAAVTALAGVGPLAGLSRAWAAGGEPIPVGALVPLTGGGSPYGPNMLKALQLTIEDINGAGGPLGRNIVLYANDSQTSPDAGVRKSSATPCSSISSTCLPTVASPCSAIRRWARWTG